jgi:hypothetical protein
VALVLPWSLFLKIQWTAGSMQQQDIQQLLSPLCGVGAV